MDAPEYLNEDDESALDHSALIHTSAETTADFSTLEAIVTQHIKNIQLRLAIINQITCNHQYKRDLLMFMKNSAVAACHTLGGYHSSEVKSQRSFLQKHLHFLAQEMAKMKMKEWEECLEAILFLSNFIDRHSRAKLYLDVQKIRKQCEALYIL